MKNPLLAIVVSGCLLLSGCGYTTNAFFLPAHIKTVHIQTLQNKSDQPNLENELRAKLVATFQSDGNLKIASEDEADAVLSGEVVRYSRQAMRYENDEAVQEYRITIAVNFQFVDRKNNAVIVKADNFSGDASFYLTGSQAKSESAARSDALDDLSHRMLNKIITLW
jgi:hypothetical protein